MGASAIDDLSPLARDLRAGNPDCYLSTLFAPPAARQALFALYAFDGEIARIQTVVREPMAGLIRLQWWDDVVDGLGCDKTVAHPVVEGLARAVKEDGLDVACLKQAIDGRRRPFEMDASPDLPSFERYLLDAGGNIAAAAAKLLGAEDQQVLVLARRVGQIKAASDQLGIIETSGADRALWLPSDWLEKTEGAAAITARQPLADWASAELADLRRQTRSIPRSLLAAFFPGTLAGARLYDRGRHGAGSPSPAAVPRLIWFWLRGRF